ncbi:hypothetical protein [Wolbachia endosymbiont (group B) of Episyrphus balteatus]|uniref:hypothetical protein n=1 Tax=Wolbachia endosymbiont (group B) of Episyrphus balteatus TaxID=2954009 RepID=UPI002227B1F1|nr:hypothetical protein [Wolbachia endosymbiont (group B) of Episyrphus balteatus]
MVMSTQNSNSLTFQARNLSHICNKNCEEAFNETDKPLCKARCDAFFSVPEPRSQISEKLIDIANNLRFESAQLSSMADEIDAYNSMSI